MSLLLGGTRLAVSAASMAARQKKAGKSHPAPTKNAASASASVPGAGAAPVTGLGVTSFSYKGQTVPVKRTTPETFKGKGGPEIQALEALLAERHMALLADSVQSFLPAAQHEAIVEATRKAVATRPNWNYAPYRQELAFYEKEEARRQQKLQLAPNSAK
ncbi:hypothetical protein HMJ29_17020 [Hymenobacter taeanensis]|uniref:Uncharacterized protein n=1 Tax=Hymenobacter taeanensis TaxID=2735321 RepID=A0A6M6BN76_9BACT|nr:MULTISPECIES: hypothetical protein [Hymenobacter]QJX48525.1 hypothetical protein HMJ29_17020 [Hymenobacter taeanensis]UOQ81977.1 hypothetical protein MUN83_04090 [Hymenobacter sp. 5414T-23]